MTEAHEVSQSIISAEVAAQLNMRGDIIATEMRRGQLALEGIKEEVKIQARAAFVAQNIRRASELAVHGSGLTILIHQCELITRNLKDRNFQKEQDIQNVSLAVIGSVSFQSQTNHLVDLLSQDDAAEISAEHLDSLRVVCQKIHAATANIPIDSDAGLLEH